MKTWILFAAVLLVLAGAAAGCVQPTEEEAEAQLCEDLAALRAALDNFENINRTSTVEEIRDARDQVGSAMQDVRDSADQLEDIRVDELDAAYSNLENAVEDLPDDATAGEALQTIRPELQAVRDARQNLTAELNCPQ
jgi:DNA repair exonuclease SbcCD ATPase subunit